MRPTVWKILLFSAAMCIAVARPDGAAAQAETGGRQVPESELSYTTRLDKTAVWVGDQFHYQIIVDHSPKIEFVLENLNRDNISMEPLRVIDVTARPFTLSNGTNRLFVDVTLANFNTGTSELQIPQITLFYFRRDGAGALTNPQAEGSAAESLTVMGPVVGLRSTLPPEPDDLRDAVTVSGWPRNRWVVAGIGWVALILLGAGLVWEGAQLVRNRQGRKGPDPRKAMAKIRERWAKSVPADFADTAAVMEFYGRSYQDIKEYLAYALETPTEGLTAEDMGQELARRTKNTTLTERTTKVLATCEVARYGRNSKDSKELSSDTARSISKEVPQIFEAAGKL